MSFSLRTPDFYLNKYILYNQISFFLTLRNEFLKLVTSLVQNVWSHPSHHSGLVTNDFFTSLYKALKPA